MSQAEKPQFRVAVFVDNSMHDGDPAFDTSGWYMVLVMNTAISKGQWNHYGDPGVIKVHTDKSETSCNLAANQWADFFGVGPEYFVAKEKL